MPDSLTPPTPQRENWCVATLTAVRGDIAEQHVEAIVTAANGTMRGGGGVDGAIHRAAGPGLLRECIERFPHGLAAGDAGWTTAGDLPATWVIHTVGPDYRSGERDRSVLESCYRRSLAVADERDARSVAFPLIGTGAHGWPHADAVEAAVNTIAETRTRVEDVRLVAVDRSLHLRTRALVLLRFPPPTEPRTIGALFDRGVVQWGLRGDPCLWRELRARLADTPLPPDWFTVRSAVESAAEEIIGTSLRSDRENVYVAEFDPGHGMSAGSVSLPWWKSTGIPILLDRYAAATAADESRASP